MLPVVLAVAALSDAYPAALVEQLGHRDFRVRERAALGLLEFGFAARPAVAAGRTHADGEIRERCIKLYPAIWKHDLARRVRRFLDDPEGASPDDLPSARRFLRIVGDTPGGRSLYAETVEDHADLLLEAQLHPERLPDLYREFVQASYQRSMRRPTGTYVERVTPPDSEILAVLFLGAIGPVRPVSFPGLSSVAFRQMIDSPFMSAQLDPTTGRAATRELFAAWLENERMLVIARRGIELAIQHQVRACLPTIRRMAASATASSSLRATALLGYARLAAESDVGDLDPFLNDQQLISTVVVNGVRGTVQIRDVALAAAVQLTKQELGDYGFVRKAPLGGPAVSSYTHCAFADDDQRSAAHAKWKAWAAANLKK